MGITKNGTTGGYIMFTAIPLGKWVFLGIKLKVTANSD